MNVWRSVTGTAGVKMLVMAAGGLLGILSSRIIIQHFGVDAYAQYGLLAGVSNLLPFADLGLGAVVINAIAESDDPVHSDRVRLTLMTAFRTLIISGLVMALISVGVAVAGWWPSLLGKGLINGGSLTATLCICALGLSLPLGLGVRILIGLHRNMLQAVLMSIQSPLFVLSIVVVAVVGIDQRGNIIPVLSYLAASVSSAVLLFVGARLIAPQVRAAARDVPRIRSVRGVPVFAIAAPVLFQSVAIPIAMQSDRVLLSHRSTTEVLAQYTFANQVFGLVIQGIVAGGVALWPYFARARSRGEIISPNKLMAAFFVGPLVISVALGFAMPVIERIVTNGEVRLPLSLVVCFALLATVQAVNYPPSMYMTEERGLRFQVLPIVCMTLSNLVLSWFLIPPLGAAGPVLGSAIAVFTFQVVPNTWWVRRDVRRRRAAAGSGSLLPVGTSS